MRRPRPGPPHALTFPTGTTIRFVLLIAVAAYAVTLFATFASSMLISSVRLPEVIAYYECHQRAVEDSARYRSEQGAAPGFAGDVDASHCHDPRAWLGPLLPVLVVAVFVLAIAAAYWLLPEWRKRRRGYVTLSAAVAPDVEPRLASLTQQAGVAGQVTFLVEPLNPRVQGLAFGRAGRRHVVLSSGLLTLCSRDPGAFDAVVLHELAHLRNRDLDIGFLTLIVGRSCWPLVAFLTLGGMSSAVILTPSVRTAQLPEGTGPMPTAVLASAIMGSFGGLFLAAAVVLLRNAVLRSRELDADARAVEWLGTAAPLQRLLAHGAGSQTAADEAPGYRHLLKVHPAPAERVRAAARSGADVRIAPLDLFAVGLITAYLYDLIGLGPLGGGTGASVTTEAFAAFVATLLLVGAVAATVWRGADPRGLRHGEVRSAQRKRALRTAGIGLGLGLCTARLFSPTFASSAAMVGGRGLSLVLPYAALCAVAGWGVVCWLERVAMAWTPAMRAARRPRLLLCAVPVLCAVGTWPALLYLLYLPDMTLYASSFVAPGWPGAVVLFWAALHMTQHGTTGWASLAVVTACAVLVAGRWWSWRPSAAAARGESGPVRPPGWLWARLGIPTGLAASVLLTPVALLRLGGAEVVWISVGAAQLVAALWAGRGPALWPVARAALAAYGAGFVATVGWAEQIALASCALSTDACHVLPQLSELKLGVMAAGPGAMFGAAVCAALYGRRERRYRRAKPPQS
ncbi:M48 family metallopeptidase [Streptomyces sp. NPDC057579]|uniref:M48 family metallopeptidase n=1 Tax=Streptomyces sp. NPDC057579 TaxID=3346172 RepID=UPI0036AC259F